MAKPTPKQPSKHSRVPGKRPTLLLAVDFSKPSQVALEAAGRFARDLGADVILLHASPRAPAPMPLARVKDEKVTAGRLAASDAARLSSEWAEHLRADGLRVQTENPVGPPVKEILDAAKRHGCRAIVLGTTGRTGVKGWLLGSVAREIVRRSKVPVLVAPTRMGTAESPSKVILVAVDFSAGSEPAYEAGLRLAHDIKAPVHLLHVVNLVLPSVPLPYSGIEFTPAMLEKDQEGAFAELAELASRARKLKVGVTPSVGVGHPASVILAEARLIGASLIVIGTHGKSASHRFFLGSVAESVVQLADRPVLVVPDPKGPDAGEWQRSA
ncbi:MAG: universal stress protein [Candidatus Thermoplasmatota archaeon]|jgi:nucleotide-binding universal stress UspA family protein